jgi:DinB family protein
MSSKTVLEQVGSGVLSRTLEEGYGPGAWHGSDLNAAIGDVSADAAFRRPAPGRHNVAEIALHHAYCVHDVRGRLSGTTPEPFVHDGGDWLELNDGSTLSWNRITEVVETEQRKLADVVGKLGRGVTSPLGDAEQFDLVLGITSHAIYHAGQIQLVKKLV